MAPEMMSPTGSRQTQATILSCIKSSFLDTHLADFGNVGSFGKDEFKLLVLCFACYLFHIYAFSLSIMEYE